MKVYSVLNEWLAARRALAGRSIGFVPTMGALHPGHRSLLERARAENEVVVLSIFVNPTQFDNTEDLKKYPVTLEDDLRMAREAGVDYVILPTFSDIYPDDYRYRVSESAYSRLMEGAHRAGHFDGVLSIVMKLFNIAGARKAYFGEKDYQQLRLVRGMAQAFFMDLEVVPCPTVREDDGLAMSSRNRRLDPESRRKAVLFPQLLMSDRSPEEVRRELEEAGFEVDYIEEHEGRRFGAVRIGGVRLIDNVQR